MGSLFNGPPQLQALPTAPAASDLSDQIFKSLKGAKFDSLLGGSSYDSTFLTPGQTGPTQTGKPKLGS